MASAIVVLSLVAAIGLGIGSLKIRGIGLGIAGVLFAGLAFGHFGVQLNPEVAEFAREFGLILFVYTIGMQVGPGFFASLRQQGAPLNFLAATIVIMGALIALAINKIGGVDIAAAVGLFSGATTNTPSLGAAQEAIKSLSSFTPEMAAVPGLAYAVAYPFGIVGIILSMFFIRGIFGIKVSDEEASFARRHARSHPPLAAENLLITNPNLNGLKLSEVPGMSATRIVISRIMHGEIVSVATDNTVLHTGDTILAVGPQSEVDQLRIIAGTNSEHDLRANEGEVAVRRIVVTKKSMIGKSIADLDLSALYNVRFTRMSRAEVDLPNPLGLRLQAGDTLTVVGTEQDLNKVSKALGNSMKDLNHPQIVPVFVGIFLGIVLGSIPVAFPGIPAPVKLGLAGGPLVVAIILSYIGRIGPLVWYMPMNANFLLRELGIVLFLACVGLKSGGKFMETLLAGEGLHWMGYGAIITVVPLLVAAIFAKLFWKINYLTVIGVMAGSMTDPPALAFANSITTTAAPAVSYATVYPLTMLLRVLSAQLLVLIFG